MSGGRRVSEFERLTRPGGKALPDDDTIPVLTERLSLPSLEIDTSLPESPSVEPPASAEPRAPDESSAQAPSAPVPDVASSAAAPVEADLPRDPVTAGAETTLFPGEDAPDLEAAPSPPSLHDDAEFDEPSFASEYEPTRSSTSVAVTIDWGAVEEQTRAALLQELQPRLAAELDRQLRERLQPTLVRMLLATVAELRPAIEAAVREAITRAVTAEVARQKAGQ